MFHESSGRLEEEFDFVVSDEVGEEVERGGDGPDSKQGR